MLRADSGFCRWRMLSWCERHDVDYIVGIARNPRLNRFAERVLDEAKSRFERTGAKRRLFDEFTYAAATWNRHRRVIVKGEYTARGANPRYIVTNLSREPKRLYDQVYCARGEMENRIKEQQLDLFADRTSCHRWWPNQFRLLMSSFAYVLLETIRRLGLAGTKLARAYRSCSKSVRSSYATPGVSASCSPVPIPTKCCTSWSRTDSSPGNKTIDPQHLGMRLRPSR